MPGASKTRLIPLLGADGAAQVHQKMLDLTIATAVRARVGPLQLWADPGCSHPHFVELRRRFALSLRRQRGPGLGERLAHSTQSALERHCAVIVIGTDCPGLQESDLCTAALRLRDGVDAVIGPAHDGGYYLIALRRFSPSLFESMPFGTSSVLNTTRTRLRELGWTWSELDVRHDVDHPDDLARYPELGQLPPQG